MKNVAPKNWEAYNRARRQGHSQASACRIAHIGEATAQRWEAERKIEANGGTSERRSSAWEWLEWREMVGEEQANRVGEAMVSA